MSAFFPCCAKRFCVLVWFTASLACFSQAPPPPPPPSPDLAQPAGSPQPGTTTLKITTREVLLDVLVIDKEGKPVPGLKATDFKVTEEGAPQLIRRVDEHHPMAAGDVEKLSGLPPLPPNTFSNYTPVHNTNASIVLLLDAMDSPLGAQMVMRQQLINYLKHMQPGPRVAIFQLDSQMRLIQGFTSDPKVLLAAAESRRDMPSMARPTAAPRSYTADAQYRRVLMGNLQSGMQLMASYLAGYPGRKNLIWFTGRVPMTIFGAGFGNPFHDGLMVSGDGDEASELTDVLTVNRVAVYPVDTRGLVTSITPASESGPRPGAMMNAANSGFWNHANLDQVAEQTGGKAYYNTNDFTRVISDVINTASSYYTLAYATTNTKWNGQLRHIKITVDRPDVTVQHKQGYYAFNLDKRELSGIAALEQRRAQAATLQLGPAPMPGEPEHAAGAGAEDLGEGALIRQSANGGFGAAMALGAVPPTEIVFATRVEAESSQEKLGKGAPMQANNFLRPEWQHKPFRNYTLFYDTDIHRVRFTKTADGVRHGKIEFVAVAYASDGEEVNSLIETATLNVTPDRYRELLVSGLQTKESIAIPVKGSFFLRLGVHDVTGEQVGALEIPVDQIKLGLTQAAAK